MFLVIQGTIVYLLNISFNTHNDSFLFLQHQGIGHLFTIKISQFSTTPLRRISKTIKYNFEQTLNSASENWESWLSEWLL